VLDLAEKKEELSEVVHRKFAFSDCVKMLEQQISEKLDSSVTA